MATPALQGHACCCMSLSACCFYAPCSCTVALRVKFPMHPTRARVWDMATGTETRKLEGHKSPVSGVAISRDNKRIQSSSADGSIW